MITTREEYKITINDKEYNLFYSIGAHIAFDNWAVQNPKSSFTEGYIQKFIFMVLAYNNANGIKDNDPPTKEELAVLPNSVFEDIVEAVLRCEKGDTERKVEAASKKGKAKSTVK